MKQVASSKKLFNGKVPVLATSSLDTIENTLVLRSINFIYHQSTCMLIGCDLEYPSILLDPT